MGFGISGSIADAQAAGPKIHIVIAEKADPLEKFAADEMAGQLKKLFDAETTISTATPADARHVILLGNPATHSGMAPPGAELPKISADAHALKTIKAGDRTMLAVVGGSPRAVLWGAYELGWQFGIRYFTFGDLYPTSPHPFTLAGFDPHTAPIEPGAVVIMEFSSPVGRAGWGVDELNRHLAQLAKLKARALAIGDPSDATTEESWDSAAASIAALRIRVDGDTAGRSAFGGKKYFQNPDLAESESDAERLAAARKITAAVEAESSRLQLPYAKVDVRDRARLLPSLTDIRLIAVARNRRDVDADFFDELLTPVCGEEVSGRVKKAFDEASAALAKIEAEDKSLDLVDSKMLLRHYESDEPPPAWWAEVRTNYLNAMNEMYRANTRAREGGRQFTLWYARRFEFGMEYMNVVEALRKAGIAKRKGNQDEQIAELEKALDSLTGACNAMAAVARSQSDRGIIAVMNEYGYRPVMKLLDEADAEN